MDEAKIRIILEDGEESASTSVAPVDNPFEAKSPTVRQAPRQASQSEERGVPTFATERKEQLETTSPSAPRQSPMVPREIIPATNSPKRRQPMIRQATSRVPLQLQPLRPAKKRDNDVKEQTKVLQDVLEAVRTQGDAQEEEESEQREETKTEKESLEKLGDIAKILEDIRDKPPEKATRQEPAQAQATSPLPVKQQQAQAQLPTLSLPSRERERIQPAQRQDMPKDTYFVTPQEAEKIKEFQAAPAIASSILQKGESLTFLALDEKRGMQAQRETVEAKQQFEHRVNVRVEEMLRGQKFRDDAERLQIEQQARTLAEGQIRSLPEFATPGIVKLQRTADAGLIPIKLAEEKIGYRTTSEKVGFETSPYREFGTIEFVDTAPLPLIPSESKAMDVPTIIPAKSEESDEESEVVRKTAPESKEGPELKAAPRQSPVEPKLIQAQAPPSAIASGQVQAPRTASQTLAEMRAEFSGMRGRLESIEQPTLIPAVASRPMASALLPSDPKQAVQSMSFTDRVVRPVRYGQLVAARALRRVGRNLIAARPGRIAQAVQSIPIFGRGIVGGAQLAASATSALGGGSALAGIAGVSAAGIGVLGIAASATATALGAVSFAAKRSANELEDYSSAITYARAQAEITKLEGDIERAARFGPRIATTETATARIAEAGRDVYGQVLDEVLKVVNPILERAASAAEAASEGIKGFPETVGLAVRSAVAGALAGIPGIGQFLILQKRGVEAVEDIKQKIDGADEPVLKQQLDKFLNPDLQRIAQQLQFQIGAALGVAPAGLAPLGVL